ncbi:MAG: hypothetical protein QOC82_2993 [Frankiaceae bacterium]|nr:hypothetical protein [Frankiaceae bacterium]
MPFGTSPALPRPRPVRTRLLWAVPTVLVGAVVAAAVAPASAYADVPDPISAPLAPASVTVEAEPGGLAISWTPPAVDGGSAITGYDMAVVPADPANGTVPVTMATDAATTVARVSGLTNGVDYTVTVSATNPAGTGPAATADGAPRTVPTAVTLTGVAAADHIANVSWQPPASDGGATVQHYVVTAHPSGRTVTVPAGAVLASVGGLVNGVTTTFSVAAVNAAGSGPAVATAAVTPRRPARLTVAAWPVRVVTYGAATHVTARLTDTLGRALPARRVVLLYRVGTGAFHTAAAGTTGSTGRVALTTKLPATATLVVRHPADAIAGVTTSVATVRVARKVTESSARAIRLGQYVVTTGAVSPGRAIGARVNLMRLIGTRWTVVAAGRMTTRTSYRVSWKPTTAAVASLRVVVPGDASYSAGWGRTWRQSTSLETVASVANDILHSTRISLATAHESGVSDNATAKGDVQALAAGHSAPRSAYQNAPGGSTPVDIRVLRALRALGSNARVMVSEIAGGSHAPGSSHYRGEAVDITVVNGVSVSGGGNYSLVASVCRSNGASVVYDPAYDPYGGHGNHVHCQWGLPNSD